jgi:hypothetical protein
MTACCCRADDAVANAWFACFFGALGREYVFAKSAGENQVGFDPAFAGGSVSFATLARRRAPIDWRRAGLDLGLPLTMSRPQIHDHLNTAAEVCGFVVPRRQQRAAKAAPAPQFQSPSIFNTNAAPDGADRLRSSAAARAMRKRAIHGKQDDHRRFPPGGNPGGGPAG